MAKEYRDLDEYCALDAEGLADTVLHCPECGRDHAVPIGAMRVGSGLAAELPGIARRMLGREPRKTALVFDSAIEDLVLPALEGVSAPMRFQPIALRGKDGHLDSTDVLGDEVAERVRGMGADFLVGAGSGVIADLTKWIATKARLPFVLYGTAASMNAHASITATMTHGGVKTSAWLDPAGAVLMDIDLISRAPKPMRLAGLGDLSARSICNADWLLGKILRGKSFCPVPFRLTASGEEACYASAAGIGSGDAAATRALAEAILVSAVSMTMMAGETSPSSGTEHVFSHYLDLQVELEGAQKNLHGIQVGLGTLLSFSAWECMRDFDIASVDPMKLAKRRPSLDSVRAENAAKFGSKGILFNEAVASKWIPDADFPAYLERVVGGWKKTWAELAPYLGDSATVRRALGDSGFDFSLASIGRSRSQALDAIVYGWRYRSRYTVLDLAWELGALDGAAERILERAGLS
jgi:glycerol-1-phosphate dehydrogenase [NAD(P)+]